jgi:hypothetical protein
MTQTAEPTTDTTSKTPVAKKPAAKKAPAKKPVVKKGVKATTRKGAASEVFAKWKAGAKIAELVKTFKLTRPQVRRQLLLGAGSREAFKALRKQGAGGTLAKAKQGEAK